ncbi:unnamed protein product [Paramecium primaurelia]|uniref:Cyclic nucleotide-binding domain-containing protein n=1 Tax=Paramecium primaurelia TaxID=5886 RepID=A0A8S1MXJ0_PARPR|nr:unnamed protein product [Paramecium primaurelia]
MIQISSPRNDQVSLKTISEKSKKNKLNYPFQPNDISSAFEINSLSFDQSELESNKPQRNTLQQMKVQQQQFSCQPINNTKKYCYNSDIIQQQKKDLVQQYAKTLNSIFLQDNNNTTSIILQQLINKNLSDAQFAKQQDKKKKIQFNENSLYKLLQVFILLLIGIMSPTQMVLENTSFIIYGNMFQITLLISLIMLHLFLKSKLIASDKNKTKNFIIYLAQNLFYEIFILLLSIILFLIHILQLKKLEVINIMQIIACIICLVKNVSLSNHSTQAGLKILLGNFIFFHLLECYKLSLIYQQSLNLQSFFRNYILILVQCNRVQESGDNIGLALLEIVKLIFNYVLFFQIFIYLLNLWNTYFSIDYLLVNKHKQYEKLMRDLQIDSEMSNKILKQSKSYELEDIKYLSLFDQIISNQYFLLQLRRLLFQQSQLFEQFSNQSKDQLIQFMELHLIHPQQIISCDNLNEEQSIYFLIHGTIDIGIQNNQNFNFEKIEELQQGQHFGQLTFFTGQKDYLSYKSNHYALIFKLKRQNMLKCLETNLLDKEILSIIINQVINKQNYSLLKLQCQCCNSTHHILSNCPQLHMFVDKNEIISTYLSPKNQERLKYIRYQNKKKSNILKFKLPKSILTRSDASRNIQKKQNNNTQNGERKSSAFNFDNNSDIPKEFTSEKILEQQILQHQLNSINSEHVIQEFQNDTQKKSKLFVALEQNIEHNQQMDINIGTLNLDCQDVLINPYQYIITDSKPYLDECESSNMINNLNSYKSRQMSGTNMNSMPHHQFISLTGQVTSILNNEFYNQFTNLNIDKWQNYSYFDAEYNLYNIVQKISQQKKDQNLLKQTQDYNMSIRIEKLIIQDDD